MLNTKEAKGLERQAIVAALFKLCDPRPMENFKLGDTVQLKSGGPIMTVGSANSDGKLNCDWFEGATLKHGLFHPAQLKAAEPEVPYVG